MNSICQNEIFCDRSSPPAGSSLNSLAKIRPAAKPIFWPVDVTNYLFWLVGKKGK